MDVVMSPTFEEVGVAYCFWDVCEYVISSSYHQKSDYDDMMMI